MEDNNLARIQSILTDFIGVDTVLMRNKTKRNDAQEQIFVNTVELIRNNFDKSNYIRKTFGIDFSQFANPFFVMVDNLITLSYGPMLAPYILRYCYFDYELNDDGHALMYDLEDTPVVISNSKDLFEFLKILIDQSNNSEEK